MNIQDTLLLEAGTIFMDIWQEDYEYPDDMSLEAAEKLSKTYENIKFRNWLYILQNQLQENIDWINEVRVHEILDTDRNRQGQELLENSRKIILNLSKEYRELL